MSSLSQSRAHGVCAATGRSMPQSELVLMAELRPTIAGIIHAHHPGLDSGSHVSRELVNKAREEYVRTLLQQQVGDLSALDEEVIDSLHRHELLSERPPADDSASLTFGQRLADRIASFGGSWSFILLFAGFLGVWIVVNVLALLGGAFDPYPFILLNLILSCLAALQAPVIMMSQNRQEERDRQRAENDYKVNLKAELEIRHLHEKVDYLLHQQATRLMEVQQIQLDLMRELAAARAGSKH